MSDKEGRRGLVFHADVLRGFVENAGRAVGLSRTDAVLLGHGVVEAELRGVTSHGLTRLPPYVRALRDGVVNPRPRVATITGYGATALLDGDNGLGVVLGQIAMDRASDIADTMGIGAVAVRNSNHTGMLAIHVMRASSRGMIGYFTSNGPAILAPFGGMAARLGNGPFAYAIPSSIGEPVVLDMASSAAARGTVRLYAADNEDLPDGWALDSQGVPTRDPHEALGGTMMPIAGHKGYGLAFVNEVLGGILPGAHLAIDMPRGFLEKDSSVIDSWESGHLAVAIKVAAFGDPERFSRELVRLVQAMKETPLAPGSTEILVPGEREASTRLIRIEQGVPLSMSLLTRLNDLSTEIGVDQLTSDESTVS